MKIVGRRTTPESDETCVETRVYNRMSDVLRAGALLFRFYRAVLAGKDFACDYMGFNRELGGHVIVIQRDWTRNELVRAGLVPVGVCNG